MDFEKDSFELELERENEGYELVLENQTEEILEKSKIKKIRKIPQAYPDIKIDFAKSEVSLYVFIPKIKLIDVDEKEKNVKYEQIEIIEYIEKLVFKKKFSFMDNKVIIGNKSYQIPFYFNLDLIVKKDTNTWENLFYRIFYTNIIAELKKYSNK